MLRLGLLTAVLVLACHMWIDRPMASWVMGLPDAARDAAKAGSHLGNAALYLVPSAAAFAVLRWVRRQPRQAWRWALLFTAVALVGIINQLLKLALGRMRPRLFVRDGQYGYDPFTLSRANFDFTSMPSGHTMVVFAAATVMSLLYPRQRWLWLSLATLIALTRVFSGSHYPGDVAAGAYLGAMLTILIARPWQRRGLI